MDNARLNILDTLLLMAKQVKTFELAPQQKEHVERIENILKSRHIAIDTSDTGSGKTACTLSLAARNGMHLIIVGPASAESVWDKECKRLGFDRVSMKNKGGRYTFFTYSTFGTYTKNQNQSINIFEMQDGQLAKGKKKIVQIPVGLLESFKETIANNPILFVFDEAHSLKNSDSNASIAGRILTNYIVNNGGPSRVLFLSATLFDKIAEGLVTILKIFGIIRIYPSLLGGSSSGDWSKSGLQEIANFCSTLVPEKEVSDLIADYCKSVPRDYDSEAYANNLAMLLWSRIISPSISSRMPSFERKFPVRAFKLFVRITDERRSEVIRQQMAEIEAPQTGLGKGNAAGLSTKALQSIELNMIDEVVRLVIGDFRSKPMHKMIIFASFKDPLERAHALLLKASISEDHIVHITGDTGTAKGVDKFQNGQARICLITLGVGKQSINLNDTTGRNPRISYMFPTTFSASDLKQASGRSDRINTMSEVVIITVWPGKDYYGQVYESPMARVALKLITKNKIMNSAAGKEDEDDNVEEIEE